MSVQYVLVTGAAGYIGSHCVLELLQNGHDVLALDNFSNAKSVSHGGASPALERVTKIAHKAPIFYQCDLLDQEKLNSIFAQHDIKCVIHLAALKSVGQSMEIPLKYYSNNVAGSINLLQALLSKCSESVNQAMKEHGVFTMVFSSSCCVYGAPEVLPITEEHTTGNVTNVYGKTKHMVEKILQDLSASDHKWNIISLRYFNPVGAHPSGLIGEDPTTNFSNLMPYLTQVAIGNKAYLEIYGADYNTIDGTGVRDYIHIMDLASGHVAALDKLSTEQLGFKAFNLGLGRGVSVLQLINTWKTVTGTQIPTRMRDRRVGDVASLVCDPSLALNQLCWTPKFSLQDMCRDAWKWQKQNPNGYETDPESTCDPVQAK